MIGSECGLPGKFSLLTLTILIVAQSSAFAAEWQTSAAVSAGGVYTDNVRLDDENKESDFIAVMTPQASLRGEGRRASVEFDGTLQINDLKGEADNVNPRAEANGEVEAYKDHFFIEADASAYQSTVDPFSLRRNDTLFRDNNAVTTYNYGITPIFKNRFADFADLEMRYGYDWQTFSGERSNDLDGSTREQASLDLSSGDLFTRFTWSVKGEMNRTDYDEERDAINSRNDRRSLEFRGNYRLVRKWQLTGSVGKEWNDFETAEGFQEDDEFWKAGFIWAPNDRTTVEAGYGERFFGHTPYANITHDTRRTRLRLGYEKQVTDTRTIRRAQGLFPDEDPFGRPIDPISGVPIPTEDNLTFQSNSVIINERFDGSFSIIGNRSTVTLELRQSKQTRTDTREEATFNYVDLSFDRELSRDLSFQSSVSYEEQERNDAARDDDQSDLFRFSAGWTYALGQQTSLSVQYTYSEEESGFQSRDYQENRISVFIIYRL